MDTFECIATKLDVREFSSKQVPPNVKHDILESARLAGSVLNTQHWRFIVIEDRQQLEKLASDSKSGSWVAGADFAVLVLTDPKYKFHLIDAGRALQNMQLAAWNQGVVSCLFTGIKEKEMRNDFMIPDNLNISLVAGFGYARRKIRGRKDRKPLDELVHYGKHG